MIENRVAGRVCAVILAAGKGTRMKSDVPKVLCKIHGLPMLSWVVQALRKTQVSSMCAVINNSMDYKMIKDISSDLCVCYQDKQLGTGDAVASSGVFFPNEKRPEYNQARACSEDEGKIIDSDYILICSGDCPGINPVTIDDFIAKFFISGRKMGLVGMRPPSPFGYGRLLCDGSHNLVGIVEEKDCSIEQKRIGLCSSGVIIVEVHLLFVCFKKLLPSNSQR